MMIPNEELILTATSHSSLGLVSQLTLATPLGEMLLAASPRGLAGAWFAGQRWHPGPLAVPARADDLLLREAGRELAAYFAGDLKVFELPLDLDFHGTPFQREVWHALRRLPAGATCTYAALAKSMGRATAARAVGSAVGRNPLLVFVPCHRVIGARGDLAGYSGGLPRKQVLLELEQRHHSTLAV